MNGRQFRTSIWQNLYKQEGKIRHKLLTMIRKGIDKIRIKKMLFECCLNLKPNGFIAG